MIAQPDLKKGFGAELKRRRIQSGISQERLAELADLHRTYISAVESGRRNLTLESIQRLASALGASVGSFFSAMERNPVLTASESADAETADPSGGVSRKAGTILLVEDDPRDVEFTLTAFKAAKLANPVQVVRDGAAALDLLLRPQNSLKREEATPYIILLDLHLPKVHGLEVLRRLKSDRRFEQTPIVVLTASRSDRDIQEAMKLGASAYLIKPVDFCRFAEITPKLKFRWALL